MSELDESRARFEADMRRMREEHFRWLLMWHGDFIRDLTLIEVERNGLRRAKARSKILDERRRAYVASIDPANRKNSVEPR